MFYTKLIATASWLALIAAQQEGYTGFNSGATLIDGQPKVRSDYEEEFRTAANLRGAPEEFSSVRLYTNIQAGTTNSPSSAFEAAINTGTTILLGLWCSGTDSIDNELAALDAAIEEYGDDFTDLVVGISVGSEDLYRTSVVGIQNEAGIGNTPDQIVAFIQETRDAIEDTPLADKPVGHVDTSSAFYNESNAEVIANCDFIGMDAYPYFEREKENSIENARELWEDGYRKVLEAAGDAEVWITEIGWPVSGPDFGNAEPSLENAETFWSDLGCNLFGNVNTWWYTLRDANPANDAQFAITRDLSTTPLFDLSCPVGSNNRPLLTGNVNSPGTDDEDEFEDDIDVDSDEDDEEDGDDEDEDDDDEDDNDIANGDENEGDAEDNGEEGGSEEEIGGAVDGEDGEDGLNDEGGEEVGDINNSAMGKQVSYTIMSAVIFFFFAIWA